MRKAKKITRDEARYLLLKHLAGLVDYWEKESRAETVRERMEGLLFSVLAALDGSAVGLPGYKIIPIADDNQWLKDNGVDYYAAEDIGSGMHSEIYKYLNNKVERPADLYDFGRYLVDEGKRMGFIK